MKRILANDGLSESAVSELQAAGFEVLTTRVAPEQLIPFLKRERISALLVRSGTEVRKEVIDNCPDLVLIGRAGVGMDNIDVEYARKKGLHVVNTPEASADSVAELVFAHLLGGVRFLHEANRQMPLEGDSKFRILKKSFSRGRELRGKTLGIIGLGSVGKAVARIGLAMGMDVVFHDSHQDEGQIEIGFSDGQRITIGIQGFELEAVLAASDYVTLHIPAQDKPLLGRRELGLMKAGAALINTARGGVVDEPALLDALEAGHISFAGLDVFESEPSPGIRLLMHPALSLSPHIGGSTLEAQQRIGKELASSVIRLLKKQG